MKILIIRDDNIGDAVLFSGALKLIRGRWPHAHITLFVRKHVGELFQLCPHVDRVSPVEKLFPWKRLQAGKVRGAWALERFLRSCGGLWMPRADLLLCPVSAPCEELVDAVRRVRAPEKFGFGGYMLQYPDGQLPDLRPEEVFTACVENQLEDRWAHEFERLQAWLHRCGIPCDEAPAPELWIGKRAENFAAEAVPGRATGVFLGASSEWRKWPTTSWCAVAQQLVGTGPLVFLGSAAEASQARDVIASLPHAGQKACVNLCSRTTLTELAACISRCRVVVSTESAGLHLAIAQDVPSVGIAGQHHMGRYVPWGDPQRHRIACVPCDHAEDCTGDCFYKDYRCIQSIPPETVLRELALLERGP